MQFMKQADTTGHRHLRVEMRATRSLAQDKVFVKRKSHAIVMTEVSL